MPTKNTPLCAVCGAPFTPRPSRVKIGMGRFCSRRCAARSMTWDNEKLFWDRVDKTSNENGCWIFTGYIGPDGYGQIRIHGKSSVTHRAAYRFLVGEIPDGWQLHHECKNRACCNPDHLTPMPQPEHASSDNWNGRKTHCPKGHPYSAENTGYSANRTARYCKTCNRDRARARYHANR